MRFYTGQHRFYCGIDLHARTMHLCILDHDGQVVFDRNLPCRPDAFLRAIAPFRDGLVVGAECMFAWYWLADLCQEQHLPFVLGHALYMKAVHGGKAKNDRLDAGKIARLLRGGTFPLAYAYPKGMRETRDLLRRRTYLVRQRAALMTHLQILNSQYNLAPFPKKLSFAANRAAMDIAQRFTDPSVRHSAAADLAVIDALDAQIGALELYLTRTAKVDDVQTFYRLRSIPGVGKVLALILLYELHDVRRFDHVGQFLSYARLVRCAHESAGKKVGTGGKKIGNAHLRWAFGEAACLFLRSSERAKRWKQKQQARRGEAKALAILAARLGRAVYHMLRKREAFDETRFWEGGGRRSTTGSFYEAVFVKSKFSFVLFLPSGAHFPRLPLEASFLCPRLIGGAFSLCAVTSWVNHRIVALTTGGFAWRDAGALRRSPATTFYACRPSGRSTRVCFRPLAIRRSLVPGRPISSTAALAHPPGTYVRSPGPVLDATKPSFHPDGCGSPFALGGNTAYSSSAW